MQPEDVGLRLNWGEVFFNDHGRTWSPRPGTFADYDIWYLWAGRGQVRMNGGEPVNLVPGTVLCLRPGQSYDVAPAPGVSLGNIAMHFDFLDGGGHIVHPPEADLPPHVARVDEVAFVEESLRQAIAGMYTPYPLRQTRAVRLVQSVLLAARDAASGAGNARNGPTDAGPWAGHREKVNMIMRYVGDHVGEPLTVESLAAGNGYSVDHFTRVFTRIAGTTPKDYIIRARLERARQMLRSTALSVEQIAHRLGYADVFSFSRQFKQRVGVPPTKWREGTGRLATNRKP